MNSEALRRKTMEELISVVVITYNQEQTIGRTLDSILMQQCHLPIEIVIGEDCSTDGTLAICQDYQRRFPNQIRLFANEPNKGIIDNYFDCLLAARGKFIADCAGDDFWTDPLKLEKEARLLEEHSDVVIVHTDWLYYNETTQQTEPHIARQHDQPFTSGAELLESILTQTRMPVIHLCTSLYRKSAFLKAYETDTFVLRNKEFGCEDLSLTFLLARQGRVGYLPDVTLNYSIGHPSVSVQEDDARQFRFVRRVSELTRYLSKQYDVNSPSVIRHLQYRLFALAMHAFRAYRVDLRQEVVEMKTTWGVKTSFATDFVLLLSATKLSWTVALKLRKVFVACKRVFTPSRK